MANKTLSKNEILTWLIASLTAVGCGAFLFIMGIQEDEECEQDNLLACRASPAACVYGGLLGLFGVAGLFKTGYEIHQHLPEQQIDDEQRHLFDSCV
jgi:hypothetical protein